MLNSARYAKTVFDLGDTLHDALATARHRLLEAQASLAHANGGGTSGRSADAALAQTAQAAIFSEALLSAAHARFEELKAVTK